MAAPHNHHSLASVRARMSISRQYPKPKPDKSVRPVSEGASRQRPKPTPARGTRKAKRRK